MRKIWAVAGFLAVAGIGCSKKSSNTSTSLSPTDQQFVTNAGYNNVDEINAGYLASTNAADSNVKAFGHLMLTDYDGAQSAIVLIADSAGFTVLSSPDPAHQQQLDAMQNLSGEAFDTTYLRYQINDDQAAIALYQSEQTNGQSPEVKAYINKYLPIIQAHLTTADSLIKNWSGH
ncbi:MAG TPA: DUF4142 domain-containing protein [Puia sp.]|nr:DUF4142 domain-containing protein [Puia sp.]